MHIIHIIFTLLHTLMYLLQLVHHMYTLCKFTNRNMVVIFQKDSLPMELSYLSYSHLILTSCKVLLAYCGKLDLDFVYGFWVTRDVVNFSITSTLFLGKVIQMSSVLADFVKYKIVGKTTVNYWRAKKWVSACNK